MSVMERKVCFVVMGFGNKTDYESGRTLDLDATYEAIIKPAAEAANLRCIRADEVVHSGLIDTEMYQMLLRADLVIADISTGNVNAVYELGVRHALRPNSTIIMKEAEGRLYFDLNHVSTFQYEHLGKDIGAREAARAKRELHSLIDQALEAASPDSPVYTFLPNLRQPILTTEQYEELLDDTEAYHENFSEHLRAANFAMRNGQFIDAIKSLTDADRLRAGDSYIIQQLALATYKSEDPSPLAALINARTVIERLNPKKSNDPETLGITGAIHKRLWLTTSDRAQLDLAIQYYGRGFDIRRDYYNGENLAVCYDYRSSLQVDPQEALYDRMSARKTREAIVELLSEAMDAPSFDERSDKKWIYATLANCLYALDDCDGAAKHEKLFLGETPTAWEVTSYTQGKSAVMQNRETYSKDLAGV